jgi:hypothetical protein
MPFVWRLAMRLTLLTTLSLTALFAGAAPIAAANLEWEVESPFRFYRTPGPFTLHEQAFAAVRGDSANPLPTDIVWRTERRLNDPDCKDASSPTACAATAGPRYEASRLGWAARTLSAACYDNVSRPRHYPAQCDRRYGWGAAREDYVLPEAHTVSLRLGAEVRATAGTGACQWSWQPRAGGPAARRTQPCTDRLTIERVPYSSDPAASGVSVKVQLPDGREFAEPNLMVEDLLVVGLGDSFASGDSNPDRPVTFSASREMVYDPVNARGDDIATRSMTVPEKKEQTFGLASAEDGAFNPKALPKRLMEDEQKSVIYRPTSREFADAFNRSGAQWMSADCHRSEYGYQFRIGLQLALENRHRAVTLVHLACTGATVDEGLFLEKDAREQFDQPNSAKVPAQLDQLADLLCRGGKGARSQVASYTLPVFTPGDTAITPRTVAMRWCPPRERKRPIDVVLLSIGGNDVGFSAVAFYAISESAGDIAPVAKLVGRQIRFGANVARNYLSVLDRRLQAVKEALRDGFGVPPGKVVQTAYEPLHYDETGNLCGALPSLGLDVQPKLKMSRERIKEAADFTGELQARLECISDAGRRADCPSGLATGRGTGFRFVTEHVARFAKRGVCARDPRRTLADAKMMGMPRRSTVSGEFEPYSPAEALPYARRWRLFHSANDAFLTANTHREGISPFDIMQPAYAALYSGALHPTAEGHAIVADSVLPHVREVITGRQRVSAAPVVGN